MFFQSTAVAVMLGAGALLLHAFNPQPDPPKVFGIFGITPVDVIRLHVTNVASEVGVPPGPCKARIGFVSGDGTVLKTADVTIADGHSVSIDLNYFEATASGVAASPVHVNVRPVFNILPPGLCFTPVSAEVADVNTARTNVYVLPQLFPPGPPTVPVNGQ
jgi:hypothetical protein